MDLDLGTRAAGTGDHQRAIRFGPQERDSRRRGSRDRGFGLRAGRGRFRLGRLWLGDHHGGLVRRQQAGIDDPLAEARGQSVRTLGAGNDRRAGQHGGHCEDSHRGCKSRQVKIALGRRLNQFNLQKNRAPRLS
jgi:hypothetical protein